MHEMQLNHDPDIVPSGIILLIIPFDKIVLIAPFAKMILIAPFIIMILIAPFGKIIMNRHNYMSCNAYFALFLYIYFF